LKPLFVNQRKVLFYSCKRYEREELDMQQKAGRLG